MLLLVAGDRYVFHVSSSPFCRRVDEDELFESVGQLDEIRNKER